MINGKGHLLALVACLTLPRAANGANTAATDLHSAGDCPALLGSNEARERNLRLRRDHLHWVDYDAALDVAIVVHQSSTWGRPHLLELEGVSFVPPSDAAVHDHPTETKPSAVVEISPSLAERLTCPSGRYAVRVDDDLGRLQVLRVLDDGLLLARDGDLYFLGDRPADAPRWLMVWGSSWEVAPARSRSKAARRPPRKQPKKRRRR